MGLEGFASFSAWAAGREGEEVREELLLEGLELVGLEELGQGLLLAIKAGKKGVKETLMN